jgi:Zn-dependent protease/CBS domain-containing protein
MFGRRIHLFTLFGFRVGLDPSWFILGLLVSWTLAANWFPAEMPGLAPGVYWIMGIAGAIGLFMSIVVHEFFHALQARRDGLEMRGITLFIFGGVAEMDQEPRSAGAEFRMAIAGPIASILIGVICLAIVAYTGGLMPATAVAVVRYLGVINIVLAVFNMIPAFPLDGGRVLRSALWHWKGSLRWATRISSRVGSTFGLLLILLGVFSVLATGNLISGMWLFLIGLFVRFAANSSYQQLLLRKALEGEPAGRFMRTDLITVPRHITLQELVDDYIYRHHHKLYPVVEDGRLFACVSTRQVKETPREQWSYRKVGDAAVSCSPENTIPPEMDAMEVLAQMRRTGTSRLLVANGHQLVGMITLKDLMSFLALKVELEEK